MLLSKWRKVDTDHWVFQENGSHLFVEVNGKPVCLVCTCAWYVLFQHRNVLKEYNFKHHYQTYHAKIYNNFQGQLKAEKIRELLAGLKKQKSIFSCS